MAHCIVREVLHHQIENRITRWTVIYIKPRLYPRLARHYLQLFNVHAIYFIIFGICIHFCSVLYLQNNLQVSTFFLVIVLYDFNMSSCSLHIIHSYRYLPYLNPKAYTIKTCFFSCNNTLIWVFFFTNHMFTLLYIPLYSLGISHRPTYKH